MGLHCFFHSRVGCDAIKLAGWLRSAFGFLILCDRLLLTLDFDFFLFSGVLPYEATSKDPEMEFMYSPLAFFPDSKLFYWGMHVLSILQAILLMLGVAPKVQILCGHVYMISFHYHNALIWEGEDVAFKIWNFLMMFLPLHRINIYDGFGTKSETTNETWPIWPYRLWQLQVCFIFAGAGWGKLAEARWQSGTAMYHISHELDFFGGPFTPDIIFNRIGPLKLLTWSSLFVESLAMITIWPESTRMLTLFLVVGLHLGIEVSMNMHCFEWLSIMAWLFFLPVVKPIRNTGTISDGTNSEKKYANGHNDQTKPIDTNQGENITPQSTSRIWEWAANVILLTVLPLFAADTAPLLQISWIVPTSIAPIFEQLSEQRDQFHELIITPYLTPLGLTQGIWNMFCVAPDETHQLKASLRLANGTLVSWKSPDWRQYHWLEKKRLQRIMTWYEFMADEPVWYVKDAFARKLAKDHGEDVVSVIIKKRTFRPPEHPTNAGFWDKARQPLSKEVNPYFTLNLCDDFLPDCQVWADDGACEIEESFLEMIHRCRKSCDFCHDTSDLAVGSRIAIYWRLENQFYDGTIRQMKEHPTRFLVEWDNYNREEERFEWLDRFQLQRQSFTILLDGDETPEEQSREQDLTQATREEEGADRMSDQEQARDEEDSRDAPIVIDETPRVGEEL